MRKTTFIFAGIMSAIIGNAYAAGENTVTSKSYVDAQDALKQNKLHTASATPANNGATVVTYTDTEGTPGERGIYDSDIEDYNPTNDSDSLVTANALNSAITNLPSLETTKLTCANDGCTLWTIQDRFVYGKCHTDVDCPDDCPANSMRWCNNGRCDCLSGGK